MDWARIFKLTRIPLALVFIMWMFGGPFAAKNGLDSPDPATGHVYAVSLRSKISRTQTYYLDQSELATYRPLTWPADLGFILCVAFSALYGVKVLTSRFYR